MSVLSESLPCVSCGYELRGLHDDGACPECGMTISRSLRGDQLSAADPTWLRGTARGQTLVGNGMFLSLMCAAIPEEQTST